MPTYQYQCNDCGEGLEIHQSFSEDALTVCPKCGGHLRKVFNAVGVVFKGSGFYRNDSRSTSVSSDAGSSSSSSSSTSAPKESSASASTTTKTSGSDSAA